MDNVYLSFCCCCFFRFSSSFKTFFKRKNNCCFSFRNSSRRVFKIWICSFVSPNVIASWRSRSSRSFLNLSSSTSASCSVQTSLLNKVNCESEKLEYNAGNSLWHCYKHASITINQANSLRSIECIWLNHLLLIFDAHALCVLWATAKVTLHALF